MNNELILAIAETWSPPGGRGLVPDVKGRMVLALKQLGNEHDKERTQLRAELEAMDTHDKEVIARLCADNEALRGRLVTATDILRDWPWAPCSRLGQVPAGTVVEPCGRCLSCRKESFLASPPATVEQTSDNAPRCCDTTCRYFGQRHWTPHELPEPAPIAHAFVSSAQRYEEEDFEDVCAVDLSGDDEPYRACGQPRSAAVHGEGANG